MPVDVSPEEFDRLVEEALDAIPDELAVLIRNVAVLVEDRPPPGEPPDLLGVYDGIALTERYDGNAGQLPDRILLFRRPLQEWCRDAEKLRREVGITVVHEIAHHFGIADDRLHELGYA